MILPDLAITNVPYRGCADAVDAAQRSQRSPVLLKNGADLRDIGVGEFTGRIIASSASVVVPDPISGGSSPLGMAISIVIPLRAKEEVQGVDAKTIVTPMKNTHIIWDRAYETFVGESVGGYFPLSPVKKGDLEISVPTTIQGCGPLPAFPVGATCASGMIQEANAHWKARDHLSPFYAFALYHGQPWTMA
jgi:hypothetical protein